MFNDQYFDIHQDDLPDGIFHICSCFAFVQEILSDVWEQFYYWLAGLFVLFF